MYFQSPVVWIFDVASRTSSSDRILYDISAQIDLPMERLAVGLVHCVVHISDMAHDRLLIEDVALFAQFTAVQHIIVGQVRFVVVAPWSFGCRDRQSVIARWHRRATGFGRLFVLDREMLSQI